MKVKLFSLTLAAVLLLGGCGGGMYVPVNTPAPSEEPLHPTPPQLVQVTPNELTLRLLESEAGRCPGENVILSPLSIEMALAMAANGAAGQAGADLKNLLGMDVDTLNTLLSAYLEREDNTLSMGNAVWFNGQMENYVNQEVRDRLSRYYNAREDFFRRPRDPAEAGVINRWVSEQTRGKIDEIITADDLTGDTLAILLNALYFNGRWEEPFEDWQVSPGEFRAPGGEERADFMRETAAVYFETGEATGFAKTYEEGYEFIAILPNAEPGDKTVAQVLGELDIEAFLDSRTGAYDVDIKIPKFELEYTASLVETLENLGLGSLFGAGALNGMLTPSALEQGLEAHVSDVRHKTYMKMYEEGTEAAAATAVMVNCGTAMPEKRQVRQVWLDRPFAFLIRDTGSGQMVFCGVINGVET